MVVESIQTDSQTEATQALDDRVRAAMSHMSMGLSPIALGLATADWWLHLASSPASR